MKNLFTSECVRKGHPDKICDLLSDAILDAYLEEDKDSRVAVEVMAYKEGIFISGEVTSKGKPDLENLIRKKIIEIGYNDDKLNYNGNNLKIDIHITKQSPDISQGVNQKELGAGDQGIMFGYATDENEYYLPTTQILVNNLAKALDNSNLSYLRPDGKCQITTEYEDDKLIRIDTIVISVQTDDIDIDIIKKDIKEKIITKVIPSNLIDNKTKILINPTGRFILGGPVADTGLTGRKIIIDTYSGFSKHGGGAFSGKDYTKVDRTASYYARYVCKNIVAAGLAKKIELQVSYAIGIPKEISLNINTFNTNKLPNEKILEIIKENFNFSPNNMIKELNLKNIKYQDTTNYSHFGKNYLPWEQLNKVNILKKYLN